MHAPDQQAGKTRHELAIIQMDGKRNTVWSQSAPLRKTFFAIVNQASLEYSTGLFGKRPRNKGKSLSFRLSVLLDKEYFTVRCALTVAPALQADERGEARPGILVRVSGEWAGPNSLSLLTIRRAGKPPAATHPGIRTDRYEGG